jgi:catechol 2,3-dioxygenase-like lactoylglutathione lyase family enzyme
VKLDHVVLEVRDPAASAAFYRDVLGLAPVRLAAFVKGAAPFPWVRVSRDTVVDLMPRAMSVEVRVYPKRHS